MADDVSIRVALVGAAKAARDAAMVGTSVRGLGTAAHQAGNAATSMGDKYVSAANRAAGGLWNLAKNSRYALAGVAALGIAGAKWGLTFDAQLETARMRFGLFTNDVQGLTDALRKIDKHSQFSFGDLADTAAQLGNFGVKASKIPDVVQGIANAASASGKGAAGLQNISLAMSQIASKGRLMGQEMLQLQDAPGARQALMKGFHMTAAELGNISAQGINGAKAIDVLTKAWTSGRLATAANAYTKTLSGQWSLLTTQVQQDIGIFEGPLAMALEHTVLPAANKAAAAIQGIFEDKNLTPQEKLRRARQVISRDLGPIADDLKQKIEDAHIPEKLGEVIGQGIPFMMGEAAKAGPKVAEAFVHGFLHAGPVAQMMVVLYGAAKVNRLGRNQGLWGGAGRGGILGGLASKYGGAAPVYVTNWAGKGALGLPGGAAEKDGVRGAFRTGMRDFGPAGALALGATYGIVASHPGPHTAPGYAHGFGSGNPNNPASTSLQGVTNPFSSQMLGGLTVRNDVRLSVDGRDLRTTVVRQNARLAARRGGG